MNGPGVETDGLGNLDLPEFPFLFPLFLLTIIAVVIIPTVRMIVLTVACAVSILMFSIVN